MNPAASSILAAGRPAPPLRLSVFDLDRTLTRRGTHLRFLLFAAAHLRPWRLSTLPLVAICAAAHGLRAIGRKRLKELMQGLLLGASLDGEDARRIADRFADRLMARGLHRLAPAQIAAERREGRGLVIATAALEIYARPLADRLGVEALVATRSAWEGGRLLSRIEGCNGYGPEKLAGFERLLAARGLAPAHVRFFSDDVADRPMFERCDEPVAVNPGPALRRLARERSWRVSDWRGS